MEIKNKYSLMYKIRLAIWLFRTKTISRKARLIRFPIDIRGRKYIYFGSKLVTGRYCRLEAFSRKENVITMLFGNNVQINDNVHICSMQKVYIGNNVLIAGKVYISDNCHGYYKGEKNDSLPNTRPISRDYYIKPVEIGDNVWIGEGSIILPGVTIGKGAIIGANSVVNKSIPENTIAAGNPVKIIKQYNSKNKIWEKVYEKNIDNGRSGFYRF